MGERRHLRRHRGHHFRVAVAGVQHRDAAGKVDVAFALDIPQLGVFGAGGEDGVADPDPARHGGEAAVHQLLVRAHALSPL